MERRIKVFIIALVAMACNATAQTLTVQSIKATAGEQATLTVSLSGATEITALQFNLALPRGVSLAESEATLGTASNGHTLSVQMLDNGFHLCSVYSEDLNTFNDGDLLHIPVIIDCMSKNNKGCLYIVRMATTEAVSLTCDDVAFSITVNDPSPAIDFADDEVKNRCVRKWDKFIDGELSIAEAAAITDLDGVLAYDTKATSFDELQYFTSVTSLGEEEFFLCSSLASIIIPEGVTSVGNKAFSACRSLASITIPESVTSIGNEAFRDCSSLTSVTIPNAVTSIGSNAFQYCSGLNSVTVEWRQPLAIPENSFGSNSLREKITLYVPAGTKSAYKNADVWKDFKEIVELPGDFTTGDVTGDGFLDSEDVFALVNYILGRGTLVNEPAADVNGDTKIDIQDVAALIGIIKKM